MATSDNSGLPAKEQKQQELAEYTKESDLENAKADFGGGSEERSDGIVTEKVDGVGEGGHHVKDSKDEKKGKKKKEKEPAQPMVPFLRLFSMADKYDYVLMSVGSIGAIIHGAALPTFFLVFGKLLDRVGTSSSAGSTNKYVLDFVYLGLIVLVSSWLEVACWMQSGDRQSTRLRSRYLQALLLQDVAYFDVHSGTGDLVTSVASDPLSVQDAISEKVGNFLHFMGQFGGGFVVGFTSQWRIALVTVAVVPMIAVAGGFYAWALTTSVARTSGAYAEAGAICEQGTSQVRTVYSFVGEKKFVNAYGVALQKTMKLATVAGLAKGLGLGITYCVLLMAWALLLWYGGILVRQGKTNGGKALATVFAVVIGSLSLGQAMPNVTAFARGRAAAYKMFEVIDREPVINKPDKTAEIPQSVGGLIELRDVGFSYPARPDVAVFKKFSMTIHPGRTVAVVGNSGSGKSTVISLIERFYDPTAGEVLLDGRNLKRLDLTWLRSQIGLVNQEPALFATSIAANILYGKDDATQEEIEEAAKAANAHSFIDRLPLRYETQVGERGIQLSGGQKQRVAIARAVLKNPRILLLDEATSALDAGSEQVVQEALDRVMIGRTTIVVAHRLSTIRNADSIAVVQEGQVVERGTHDELISKEDGAYSALVRLQELAASNQSESTKRSIDARNSRSLKESRETSSYPRGTSKSFSFKRGSPIDTEEDIAVTDEPEQLQKGGKQKEKKGSVIRLLALTKGDRIFLLLGAIGSMCTGCINPAFAFILGQILSIYYIDNNSRMKSQISKYALIFAGLGLLSPFLYTLQHYSLGIASERLVMKVRKLMFAQILSNELGWHDEDDNNSSHLSARLAADATNVRAAIGDRISVVMQNFTLIMASYITAFVLNWKMTFVMLCGFPLLIASAVAENLFLTGFAGDQSKAYNRATKVAGEAVANIRTVAAFNAEKKVQELFKSELRGPVKKSFWRGQVAGFGFGFAQMLMYFSYALGLWYAGKLVQNGEASLGSTVKVFLILVVCAFGTAETLALSPDLVKGGQAVESVFQILDRKTKIESDSPDGEIAENIRGDIQLKRVTFAYPSRPDVIIFENLNLAVYSGRSLAIVGTSGSGKSSVIALIERFYDPLSGQVLIDEKDIRKYNLRSIRQHIALVQQEPALFSTSVYENILHGKEGASEAEVIEAAKAANAHNFISILPDGYKTEVGERGVQLSGGQKQRVAIARAVLKDPAILLLDEATSALDAESEKIVEVALDRLMKGRTTIIVAHRLSTIRGADSIAVVQDGTIVEEGSHADLIARGGGYSRLINLQNRVSEAQSFQISNA